MAKDGTRNASSKRTIPDFFKLYLPEYSSEKLGHEVSKIPCAFIASLSRLIPNKVTLRRSTGRIWLVEVGKIGSCVYFQNGWQNFVKENSIKIGDFLVFRYNGDHIFDFKLYGNSGCEKGETDGPCGSIGRKAMCTDKEGQQQAVEEEDKEEEMEEEDEDEDYEEEEDKEEEMEEEDKDEDYEEEEEESETLIKSRSQNEIGGSKGSRTAGLKVDRSSDRARSAKIEELVRHEAEKYVNPTNPFFVTQLNPKRRSALFIPTNVIKDQKLKLLGEISFKDQRKRTFFGKVAKWRDGRTTISKWETVCKWNNVGVNDWCVCELMQGKGRMVKTVKVHIIREAEIWQRKH